MTRLTTSGIFLAMACAIVACDDDSGDAGAAGSAGSAGSDSVAGASGASGTSGGGAGGGAGAPATVTRRYEGEPYPQSVAVDDRDVYWSRVGTLVGDSPLAGLFRGPKEGGAVTTLLSGVAMQGRITIDDQHVFFASAEAMFSPPTVERMPKGGGERQVLIDGKDFPPDGGIALARYTELALDGDTLFALSSSSAICEERRGAVMAVKKAGGAPTELVHAVGCPSGLVVDATDVYYVDGGGSGLDAIMRVPRAGGAPTKVLDQVRVMGGALASDGGALYFVVSTDPSAATQGDVVRMPKAGGSRQVLSASRFGGNRLVVGDGTLYSFANLGGGIEQLPLGGGATSLLVSSSDIVQDFVLAPGSVYFITYSSQGSIAVAPR